MSTSSYPKFIFFLEFINRISIVRKSILLKVDNDTVRCCREDLASLLWTSTTFHLAAYKQGVWPFWIPTWLQMNKRQTMLCRFRITELQSNFGGEGPFEGHPVWSFTQTTSLHFPLIMLLKALPKRFPVVSKLKLHLKTDSKSYFFKVTNSGKITASLWLPQSHKNHSLFVNTHNLFSLHNYQLFPACLI